MITYYKYLPYDLQSVENQVPVASRRVLVSHLRVLMSRQPVPVPSRQVPIGYEFTLNALQMPSKSARAWGYAMTRIGAQRVHGDAD
jgi:hypothetical protein